MISHRKGQTAAGPIMVLILLIALFIILYLLLIPPEDRNRLLNRTTSNQNSDKDNNVNPDISSSVKTLLLESPGIVSATEEDKITRHLNPVSIFVRYEPSLVTLTNSLSVEKGAFSEQDQNIFFDISDVESLRKATLTFAVEESKGRLEINLNENSVFNEEVDETSLQIVNLPKTFLRDKNELVFSVSGPGGAFWSKNEYNLQDVKLKQEYEVLNAKEARTFVIPKNELDNLDKSRLEYGIYCNSLDSKDTSFRIYMNEQLLLSEIITCGSGQRSAEISSSRFVEGENEVLFVIDDGDYLINDIKLTNELKKSETRTYFFNINSKDFFDVQDRLKDVFLDMSFDKEGSKIAEIWVNDFTIFMDTDESSFSEDISELIEEGENFIRILPDNEFLIRSLRITLD